jgi:septal ring factor EnvC (AmiA/AmiB activator)
MSENTDMQISRAPKLEWNLNTIIQLVTLGGMIVGGVIIWVDKSRDIDDLQVWRSNHEQLHKERLVEVKSIEARADERFKNLETDVRKLSAMADNLSYRITTNEQATSGIASTVKDIQTQLSQQSGDLREIKVILQRMEKVQRP